MNGTKKRSNDDFLKNLLNNHPKQGNTALNFLNGMKPNSRQGVVNGGGHRQAESFDVGSRNTLDKALLAYKSA